MRSIPTRTIVGRINADGTVAAGGGFFSRKTAVGLYTITFGIERLLGISCTPIAGGGGAFVSPASFTNSSANIAVGNTTGVNTDGSFVFTATVAA